MNPEVIEIVSIALNEDRQEHVGEAIQKINATIKEAPTGYVRHVNWLQSGNSSVVASLTAIITQYKERK